jgi:hypothetical protein
LWFDAHSDDFAFEVCLQNSMSGIVAAIKHSNKKT